jgi:L-glutamine-phosphate cytidylyltransferase
LAKLRAAVLAAGRGVRMGGQRPKSLIPIGDGEPLLGHILGGLQTFGIADVLIVTGFESAAVQDYASQHSGSATVTFTRNARYASWGNFHSVRMALDASPGFDVLVINSDVVVSSRVFADVAQGAGDLVLAIQKRARLDAEDMRVELRGERVAAIGKNIKMVRSHGEFCGVSLLRPPAARLYGDIANELEWRATTSLYYEDVYARMLDRLEARAVLVPPEEYAEVDTPEDLDGALAVLERLRAPGTSAG